MILMTQTHKDMYGSFYVGHSYL